PSRLGSLVVPGMPNWDAQFVPAWALSSVLTVRVSPARNSLINVGVKIRVSEMPYRDWPLLVVAPNVPSGLPEKGFEEVSQRSRIRTAKLSFSPSRWSTLKRKLSQSSGVGELTRKLFLPDRFGAGKTCSNCEE